MSAPPDGVMVSLPQAAASRGAVTATARRRDRDIRFRLIVRNPKHRSPRQNVKEYVGDRMGAADIMKRRGKTAWTRSLVSIGEPRVASGR